MARTGMALDRRTLLKGSATLGAAAAAPLAASAAAEAATTRLIVFDSRIAESRSFAAAQPGTLRLDLADAHDTHWAALRRDLPAVTRVEGLTGWSDWIAVRGELETRGLRLAGESPVKAPLSGRAHLFRWSLKAR